MKILSVGDFKKESNTCLHRHKALQEIAHQTDKVELYADVLSFNFKVRNRLFQKYNLPLNLPDENNANEKIKKLVNANLYDIIWIDKGITINSSTLKYIKDKNPQAIVVSYTADNMVERHNQSKNFLDCIPFYDYHITTKSYIIEGLKALGAKNIVFTNQSFEPSFHHPIIIDDLERVLLGGDIGFIGMWEEERCKSILFLVDNGLKVKVYGGGKWKLYQDYSPNLIIEPPVYSRKYTKVLQSFKISLCFLRKINLDLQTSRTMEIPACGGFMMAERTSEHQVLFEEDKEAVFFSSNKELLKKCVFYLNNERLRNKISKAGFKRCIKSGYSNLETLKKIISKLK